MSDFARIKEAADLREFIPAETGFSSKAFSGYSHLKECPFCHGHGCFTIYPDHYHCFQCGKRGDVFQFIQEFRQVATPLEALKFVARKMGVQLEYDGHSPREGSPRQRIFEIAAVHYERVLNGPVGEEPLTYLLQGRGHSRSIVEKFAVGLTDGTLLTRLSKDFSPEEMLQSGLILSKDGRLYDAFPPGYFVFPHRMDGRTIGDFTLKPLDRSKSPIRLRTEFREPGCLFFNQIALKSPEIVLVEGQHDLLTVAGKGCFPAVLATCGQLSGEQIDQIAEVVATGKTVYAAFDQDDAGTRYFGKLLEALQPLPGRLLEVLQIKGSHLRKLVWGSTAKDIDDHLRDLPEPAGEMNRLVRAAKPAYRPLSECLALYQAHCNREKFNYFAPEAAKVQAGIIFEWFGDRFLSERRGEQRALLAHEGQVHEIGDNAGFRTLLFGHTGIVPSEPRAKIIFPTLDCLTRLHGRTIELSPCFHYERPGTLYLHTGKPDGSLLKVSRGQIGVIPNGSEVFLNTPNKMDPIEFDASVDIKASLLEFQRLFLMSLSTTNPDRYFIASWILSIFLLGIAKERPLIQFRGDSRAGKSTAAAFCSYLIYGRNWLSHSKPASDYSDAVRNPLTLKDNLENRNLDELTVDFLIHAATGTVNQKRKKGTDSLNVYERIDTQVVITSIEPLTHPELVNRVWEVQFSRQHRNSSAVPFRTLPNLVSARSRILSAFLLVLAREILPTLHQRRDFYQSYLETVYPNHPKDRFPEYSPILFTVMEALLKYLPDPSLNGTPEKITREMIDQLYENQRTTAGESEGSANHVLFFLDRLISALLYAETPEKFRQRFQIGFEVVQDPKGAPRRVSFRGKAGAYLWAFSRLGGDGGSNLYCPFKAPQQLGSRIQDSLELLQRSGWKVQETQSRGTKFYTFIRDIEPGEFQ